MTHDDFIKLMVTEKRNRCVMYYVPELGKPVGSQHLVRSLKSKGFELSAEQWYVKHSGISGVCGCCGSATTFDNISRGYGRYCSRSCSTRINSKIQWEINRPAMLGGVINGITTRDMWKDRNFVYHKNKGQFHGYESLGIYIISFGEYVKFGIHAPDSDRVGRLLSKTCGELVLSKIVSAEDACSTEADMYMIGEFVETGLLDNDGKLEIRDSSYLDVLAGMIENLTPLRL